MASKHIHYRIGRRGFTIIECLLGLAISAMLLTAVAAAFNASVISYRENEDMFWTMNNARQALTRMTSEIRTAGYLPNPSLPNSFLSVDPSAPPNKCRFYTPTGELITYQFRDVTYPDPACRNKLYLVKTATNQEYVLCDNVIVATFTKTPTETHPLTLAKSVLISLTVQSGHFQRTLAAAAVVRRNP
ncbi:MAG: prepilin-type N-terminal cleavage/methylation domain-containing protein [Phycisphaerae bacterium]|nr:prepilin-type N-terminal cleavage/methylation domain-containing protein [Phycisphaerae bacterium]